MSKHTLMLFVALSVLGASAMAGGKPGTGPGTPGVPGKPISWEELRARCENPERFDVQRAPQNIRIQCTDSHVTWVAAMPGEVFLPGNRRVTSGVFADKFFVDARQHEVPIFSKNGSCHRFKEVEETMTIERPVTCADVLSMKGDLGEFCQSVLDSTKGANPKLIDVRETGRMIDTCGGNGTGGVVKPKA